MNLSICTSFYNGYGHFIPDCLDSIAAQIRLPAFLSLVALGSEHGLDIRAAGTGLTALGIPYSLEFVPFVGMEAGRSFGVANWNTEWIMYLDADDVLMPNAVADFATHQKNADVICGGIHWQRASGDIVRLYQHASNEQSRQGVVCCCSHAPYRRRFWEQTPYITANDFVEQPIWRAFAHLGARFVPTATVCSIHRQRHNSHAASRSVEESNFAKEQHLRVAR